MPFTADYLYDMVPIMDDEELKKAGKYSEETLVERYRKNAKLIEQASAPLDYSHREILNNSQSDDSHEAPSSREAPLFGD